MEIRFVVESVFWGRVLVVRPADSEGKNDLIHWGAIAGEYKLRTLFAHAMNVCAFKWIGLEDLGTERLARIDSLSYAGVAIRMGFLHVPRHSRSMFMRVFMVS